VSNDHSSGIRVGVDLGGTKIEAMALASDGRALARRRVPTPQHDYEGTVNAVAALVAAVEADAGGRGTIGVGTPGAISTHTGRMKNCNSTWLNGRPLAEDLARALGRPVRLANDANCFALSEAVDGAARGAELVFGVILGTGVGGGVVVHGKPLVGANGISGEWGHNPLPWPRDDERPGPPCYCGRSGCIETWLSGPGLAADHARGRGERLAAAEIAARAAAGDASCAATLDRHAERLARALAHVVNILDPDVVVLGGGVSNVASLYDLVPALWRGYVFSDAIATRLVANLHGDASGVRGAAWLW
jgi:fructokinase